MNNGKSKDGWLVAMRSETGSWRLISQLAAALDRISDAVMLLIFAALSDLSTINSLYWVLTRLEIY